ncbi:N-acetylmuramoyl-L-alanine amidase LytC precursor [Oxobacter pfennigii]|uniref:N-acetylmuramoyl-L-alanine amidase LytC n=1 Tax=Oxobacter pfennigii TaxID=36849 RepID=A0A0P8YUL7_9CLOT|nr:cell wall-binding repeat-containing protein [Oxobacter pfennigii]KPU43393.1 N-acetylmuramoyl-L-alanine amidase LytC precursor [Oxobacter pfennigii]
MSKARSILSIMIIACACILFTSVKAYAWTQIDRLAGEDRYSTAIEVSKYGWKADSTEYAIIATGEDYADALCAAPLAHKLNAPILLNAKNSLDSRVSYELKRLGVKKVYIIGDREAIWENVKDAVTALGISCTRISGSNKYETQLEIAKTLGDSSEIVIASESSFADVLSIAPIAAKKGMPVILTSGDVLPKSVVEYIRNTGVKNTYIIGGPDKISSEVAFQVPNPKRIFGQDRYETNVEILKEFSNILNFSVTYIATGNNFPDALAGSAIAPVSSSPIILVDKEPGVVTKNYVALKMQSIDRIKVLGGEGAVATSTLNELVNVVSSDKYNDFSLRYNADFKVKVHKNVNWVPANVLGKPQFTKEQLSYLIEDPDILKTNLNTLYDVIQYIRYADFKGAYDVAYIDDKGNMWEHYKPGFNTLVANKGGYGSMANLGVYLLSGDYEEVGVLQYFQEDGTGYAQNYVKHNGKYYIFTLTHYRNDFRYSAVESGNLEDYHASDYIAGNIHEADSLNDYVAYCRQGFKNPPELFASYSLENVLPASTKKINGTTFISFPIAKKDAVSILYDVPNDGITFDFIEGPSQYPSWASTNTMLVYK